MSRRPALPAAAARALATADTAAANGDPVALDHYAAAVAATPRTHARYTELVTLHDEHAEALGEPALAAAPVGAR